MHKHLIKAAVYGLRGNPIRRAYIGAVGIRSDGTIVYSYNGCAEDKKPPVHAEARLVKKLDYGSIVYVSRVRRDNSVISMAKPCTKCFYALKHRGVEKVHYTISENEWGTIEF